MQWPRIPYEIQILWKLGGSIYCSVLYLGCSSGNNFGDSESMRFYVFWSLPHCWHNIMKGTHCCEGAVTPRLNSSLEILWGVTLSITKMAQMEFTFTPLIHRSLSPPCPQSERIKILLHKLLTILQWTVFLWPNSWLCFHMNKGTKVPKCQMIFNYSSSFGYFF